MKALTAVASGLSCLTDLVRQRFGFSRLISHPLSKTKREANSCFQQQSSPTHGFVLKHLSLIEAVAILPGLIRNDKWKGIFDGGLIRATLKMFICERPELSD